MKNGANRHKITNFVKNSEDGLVFRSNTLEDDVLYTQDNFPAETIKMHRKLTHSFTT